MNMFKSNGGFTLVELIVVIAILAILAGVAVPVYSTYIQNANESVDNQTLEAGNTAIASAVAMEGKNLTDADTYIKIDGVSNGVVTLKPVVSGTATTNDVFENFAKFYTGSAATSVTFNISFYTNVVFDTTGEIVGE